MIPIIQEASCLLYKVVLQVWHLPYDPQRTQCVLIPIVSSRKGGRGLKRTFFRM